jgi:hypothetical protein
MPVAVAEQPKAWSVFARSDYGIVGSNPIRDMVFGCVYDLFCIYVVLCVGRGLVMGLITGPRSPTVCKKWLRNWIRGQGTERAGSVIEKKVKLK